MVNGITVKSSSLNSPGLNAPLGQRHLMALWAGSRLGSAFGSQPWKSLARGYFCSPSSTANLQILPKWNRAGKCSCMLSVAGAGWIEPCWCGVGRCQRCFRPAISYSMSIPCSLPGFLHHVTALPPAAALQLPLCSSGLSQLSCSRCHACGFNIFLCGLLTLGSIGS